MRGSIAAASFVSQLLYLTRSAAAMPPLLLRKAAMPPSRAAWPRGNRAAAWPPHSTFVNLRMWSGSMTLARMDLREELMMLRELGFTHLDLRAPAARAETDETLDDLARIALACTKCKLAGTRTQVVYGVG